MFTAALLKTSRTWKQLRCPSTNEWKKKIWVHIYNGILVVVRWMNLEPVIQSELSQKEKNKYHIFSSVQLLSHVWLSATPWIAASQASLSITNSRSLLKLMSIMSVMPSSHLILWRPLLLLPPIPTSIGVFSNESTLCMRWPKYWSFSFLVLPMNTQDWSL